MLARHDAGCNEGFWTRGECVDFYANRVLRRVERVLLVRHRSALSGARVLELGCGAGRLTGHLSEIAGEVHGVDLSPAMIAYCRRAYPRRCTFEARDLRDLSGFARDTYAAVFAPYNVLDALDDKDRRDVLAQVRTLLAPGGLLVLSAHNRAYAPRISMGVRVLLGSPRRPVHSLLALPRRLRNRRRLVPLERSTPAYAIRNDEAHDFALLHYYVSRDEQERQLLEHGFELLECLDLDGRRTPRGARARRCPELHYVARRVSGWPDHHASTRTKNGTYHVGGEKSVNAVWTYKAPSPAVADIIDHVAFYPDRVDAINERLPTDVERANGMSGSKMPA